MQSFSLKKCLQANRLQLPQWGPYGETDPLTGHFYVYFNISFYLSLRLPGKGAPSMFPNRVPMDRDTPSPEPLVYLFIHSFMYVCRSPQKGDLLYMGKNIRSPSTEPHADGRSTYNGVRPGSPRGMLLGYSYTTFAGMRNPLRLDGKTNPTKQRHTTEDLNPLLQYSSLVT
jgi:hypothetical protein